MRQLTHENATEGQQDVNATVLFEKAEWLCRTVAERDLGATPLYIVPTCTLPEDYGGTIDCRGFTTPSLDLYLKDDIPKYRGRGPCMVIEYPIPGDLLPEDVEHSALVTVLHELAHILDRPALYADRTGVNPDKIKFESLVVANPSRKPRRTDLPPYFGHASEFIRACLHLRHRVRLAGIHIAANNLCGGWQYGLSPASQYARALGNEPARMIDATFRDILTSPPPTPFRELWERDIRD